MSITVLYKFKDLIYVDYACKKWSQVSIQNINRTAKEKTISKNAYARALVEVYNNRRTKNRLNADSLLD
ncbi:MAG: hypothetical protein MJ108_08890 [Saccharofermentans sp.]|nr:hypothetical protein [Saccharofermentans sp.]